MVVEDRVLWIWQLAQETIMSWGASFEVREGNVNSERRAVSARCGAGLNCWMGSWNPSCFVPGAGGAVQAGWRGV